MGHQLDNLDKMWHCYWMLNRYLLLGYEVVIATGSFALLILLMQTRSDSGTAGESSIDDIESFDSTLVICILRSGSDKQFDARFWRLLGLSASC